MYWPRSRNWRLVHALAFQRDQAHRQARGVELQHDGRQRAGRQAAQIGRCEIGDDADGVIGVRAGLEIDFDEADAGKRARFDVVDAAREREESLESAGDVVFDLFGRHARKERRHHDHRNVDRWEQVHRHSQQTRHSHHTGYEADDDDEKRIAKGETGHDGR